MKKLLGTGIAIGIGTGIYDYLTHGAMDWKRAIFIAIIATLILFIFEKVKESNQN